LHYIGNFEVLNSKLSKQILFALKEQFCFDGELDYVFLKNKKEKIYVLNREIELIDYEKLFIDALGLYFGKFYSDGFRLSIEGSQLIGARCKCNVVELSQREKHDWLRGFDLNINVEYGFVLLKSGDDFLGCAKVKNFVAYNSVPSARTLKVVNEDS